MATDTSELLAAMNDSIAQDRIVYVEFAGDQTDLEIALHELYDGEIDATTENDGTIDVWGYETIDRHVWRLCVRLTA